MECFDLAPWVHSPEIRDHLQKTWTPTTMEQEQLILHAHRPLEEKANALRTLARWADSVEEKTALKNMYKYYQFAIRRIREEIPGCLYLYQRRIASAAIRTDFDHSMAGLAVSHEDLVRKLEVDFDVSYGWDVRKYIPAQTGFSTYIEFNLEDVDGQLRTTEFYYPLELFPEPLSEEERNDLLDRYDNLCCSSFPIPFPTGSLVCLDVPALREPIFGILCNELDGNQDRRVALGYIQESCFGCIALRHDRINMYNQYRAIDWLHGADASQLPEAQKILGDLSAWLQKMDSRKAEELFFDVFGRCPGTHKAYHNVPVTLGELFPQERMEG